MYDRIYRKLMNLIDSDTAVIDDWITTLRRVRDHIDGNDRETLTMVIRFLIGFNRIVKGD